MFCHDNTSIYIPLYPLHASSAMVTFIYTYTFVSITRTFCNVNINIYMHLCIPYTYSATVTLTYTHTFVSLTHTFCHDNTYIHMHICITTHTFCHDNTYFCMHLCIPYTHVQSWQHLHIHALLYPLHTRDNSVLKCPISVPCLKRRYLFWGIK